MNNGSQITLDSASKNIKKSHVSTRSLSSQGNQSFVHISCFSFNTQVLVKALVINDSLHSPAVHLRCKSGEAPMLTPYTSEPFEFVFDPESSNPTPDSLLPKFLYPTGLELQFTLDSTTMGISGNKDGDDWFFLHVATNKEVHDTLTNLSNDPTFYTKCGSIYPVKPEVSTTGKSQKIPSSTDLFWSWRWSPLQGAPTLLGGNKNICAFIKRTSTEYHMVAEFCFWTPVVPPQSRKPSMGILNQDIPNSTLYLGALSPPRHAVSANPTNEPSIPEDHEPTSSSHVPKATTVNPYASATWETNDDDNDTYYPGTTSTPSVFTESQAFQPEMSNGSNYSFQDDDGPVFRATLSQLEKKVHSFKQDIKRILKLGQEALDARKESNRHDRALMDAVLGFPSIQPLAASYLNDAMQKIFEAEEAIQQQKIILMFEPLKRLYDNNIKAAEAKKKHFDQVSDEYYSYLSKYLSARKDKDRKGNFTDAKYQERQKQFELCRFNYYNYVHELRGGSKDQEILNYFTNYAAKHLTILSKLHNGLTLLKPGLDQIQAHISEMSKELSSQRKDLDEKRRQILKSETNVSEVLLPSSINLQALGSPGKLLDIAPKNKFHGIRDLQSTNRETTAAKGRKKEGFLFTSSRTILGPSKREKNLPGQISWHKKWCVLSGGYLHEYNNWKKQLEANFEPVPLQFATARVAYQNARKFCFEVVTPKLRRQYQATSEEDMMAWIACISNSIESLWNGTSSCDDLRFKSPNEKTSPSSLSREVTKRDQSDRQYLLKLLQENESNRKCADCNAPNPEWCSINFGILICIECSGIHRSLGTHITKVRSLTLDVVTFTPDFIALIKRIGNDNANLFWESRLNDPDYVVMNDKLVKPTATDDRKIKLRYITAKYSDHRFMLSQVPAPTLDASLVSALIEQLLEPTNAYSTHTATCFAGIIQSQLMPTLQSIVLGGDPNGLLIVSEESPLLTSFEKGTLVTPLHVALYHISTPEDHPEDNFGEFSDIIETTPYYLAELLIQNGANVNIETPEAPHTLLQLAALQNNLTIIRYLLLKGAQPTLPSDSPDSWACFLATDLACQQLLFEVTYTEAQKLGLDDRLLEKVKPAKPSDDEENRLDCEAVHDGSPGSSDEFTPNSLPNIRNTPNKFSSRLNVGPDRPDLNRSTSVDTRSLAYPIKRLSGGWKQQLQQFSKEAREAGHQHNHSTSNPSPPFLKKGVFRRSGQPPELSTSHISQPIHIPIRQTKSNNPSEPCPSDFADSASQPPRGLSKPVQFSSHTSPQNSPPPSPRGMSTATLPADICYSEFGQESSSRGRESAPPNVEGDTSLSSPNRKSLKPTRTATLMGAIRKLSK